MDVQAITTDLRHHDEVEKPYAAMTATGRPVDGMALNGADAVMAEPRDSLANHKQSEHAQSQHSLEHPGVRVEHTR